MIRTSHDGSKLFEEFVRAARRKRDDALARLIADVHEGVTGAHRDEHEAASLAMEHVVVDLHFVAARQEVDGFVLVMVRSEERRVGKECRL